MDSCPKELEPYDKAHKLKLREQDCLAWMSNQYTLSAVFVAVEHCLMGKKAKARYVKNPFMQEIEGDQVGGNNKELTEEEKRRQTEQLFLKLRIMGANFNLNREKQG